MGWKKYLLSGFGLIVILLLLWWAGIGSVVEILKTSRLDYFLLAVLAYLLGLIAWALRWHVLIRTLGIRASPWTIIEILMSGVFVNNITPGMRGGGEALRVYYLSKKTGEPYANVFATVMMDRIMDVVPIVIMLLLATVHTYRLGSRSLTLTILLMDFIFFSLLMATLGVSLSESRTRRVLHWIYRLFVRVVPKKASKYEAKFLKMVDVDVPAFQRNFRFLLKHRRAFLISLLYSFVSWFFVLLRSYFIFMSIKHPVGLPDVMVVQMIGTVIGMLSVVPGGAGLVETVNSTAYILIGIEREVAVTATLLERLVSYWAPTAIGAIVTARFSVKIKRG
ncbi:hypothetical protein A3L12_04690 [Thermococcus sp. P6]|uniref:lysylphosphatidylglycerol synthase transmembrane domain-containing protein n=1 Tax=Thermococcus sp. P6 TaxID=122420 RepID=UPI000B59CDA7|nr:flippase-like domain-containing protein [Thermococcus sp. P6]ASJ10644.1 hypothetical protein A3L12_04690 [Thermococcus sp. P6]